MNHLEIESKSVEYTAETSDNKRRVALGGLIGGLGMMSIALIGMSVNEAETPQDAIGSVVFSDRTYYVVSEEVPFITLGALGAISAITAGEYLRRPEEE